MDNYATPPPAVTAEQPSPDPNRPKFVSVLEPIEPAIEHVKLMLFRPFDLGKWFIIGFCAWLAYLGEGGGGGNPGGGGPRGGFNQISNQQEFSRQISEFKSEIWPYLPLIIIGGIFLIVFVFIISLVLAWLRSRGRFMFVHCIAENKAEVVVPWNKYSRHGNSLFLFKVVVSIISLLVILLPVAAMIFSIIAVCGGMYVPAGVIGIIAAVLILFVICILMILIHKFTDDFVVPIMFINTASVVEGWKKFLAIAGRNKARLLLYILFQIVISIVISIIGTLICCIGFCLCCSCILLCIPYIGTVVLLPLLAFKRSYSLFYLRQFGPQYDVFIPQVNIPTAQG